MSDTPRQNAPEDASEGAIRTSFSLDRYARERIRETAHKYGVPQSEIVNRSARLFEFLAERSLQRRSQNLSALRTLLEQAERSLAVMSALAPHLKSAFDTASEMVSDAVVAEALSVSKKMVYGAEADGFWVEELDLKDPALLEKSLADDFPELGPRRYTSADPAHARADEIKLHYDPYGPLSSGRVEVEQGIDLLAVDPENPDQTDPARTA
ncbi:MULTISPECIES: hypothetical protein [unclassified Thiocapsa]|uniref:hypothetical protein n=1 Tax=unclassified Thiocapsa TaxID=2641286 RepID=UPI0035B0F761